MYESTIIYFILCDEEDFMMVKIKRKVLVLQMENDMKNSSQFHFKTCINLHFCRFYKIIKLLGLVFSIRICICNILLFRYETISLLQFSFLVLPSNMFNLTSFVLHVLSYIFLFGRTTTSQCF